MATINLQVTNECAGGGNWTVSIDLDGGSPRIFRLNRAEISDAIEDKEMEAFATVLMRAYKTGRTGAQARSGLMAGIAVIV